MDPICVIAVYSVCKLNVLIQIVNILCSHSLTDTHTLNRSSLQSIQNMMCLISLASVKLSQSKANTVNWQFYRTILTNHEPMLWIQYTVSALKVLQKSEKSLQKKAFILFKAQSFDFSRMLNMTKWSTSAFIYKTDWWNISERLQKLKLITRYLRIDVFFKSKHLHSVHEKSDIMGKFDVIIQLIPFLRFHLLSSRTKTDTHKHTELWGWGCESYR